eukprot:2794504-Rhodomonas_salina.1
MTSHLRSLPPSAPFLSLPLSLSPLSVSLPPPFPSQASSSLSSHPPPRRVTDSPGPSLSLSPLPPSLFLAPAHCCAAQAGSSPSWRDPATPFKTSRWTGPGVPAWQCQCPGRHCKLSNLNFESNTANVDSSPGEKTALFP